ncbi:hypothetical protein FRX31_009595, partial [Thalictrum thalictroides]
MEILECEKILTGGQHILQGVSSSLEGSNIVPDEENHQMRAIAIAKSIYNCETEEDKGNFIKYLVLPLAKELGMMTSMGEENVDAPSTMI